MSEILSVGARGPLGLSSMQLALCLRAARMEPHALDMLDKRRREIGMCVTGGLGKTLYGFERMLGLAVPALREAMRGLEGLGEKQPPIPLVLCLPERGRPDDDARLEQNGARASQGGVAHQLAERSGANIDAARATLIRAGHAGGAYALQAARDLLASGAEHVVVGGVDTYYHPEVLAWLDDNYRLHALDAEDGIVPSEGAAFAVLSNRRPAVEPAPQNHAAVDARLVAVETATEDSIANGTPNAAAAMTQLVVNMTASVGTPRWVLTDVNGERHRIREWSFVSLRQLDDDVTDQRCAMQLGDVGAAFGPTLLAIACQYFRRGIAPSSRAMIALHAEGAERGVFALQKGASS